MITKMKKLSFLIHSKEYEGFLEHLRSLGVVHIIQKQQGTVQNEELQEDLNLLSRYRNALRDLEPLAAQAAEIKDDHTKGFSFDTPAKVIERYDILEADDRRRNHECHGSDDPYDGQLFRGDKI